MSPRDAEQLRLNYSRNHGLLIEGLVRDLQVDPLDYYRKVDDAVPLDSLIRPNPQLRRLLEDIDKSKVKLWMFTNAYVNHAKRVVKLLGVADLFEGITYCDYGEAADNEILACKPRRESFERAMKESNAASVEDCFFVGKDLLSLHIQTCWAISLFIILGLLACNRRHSTKRTGSGGFWVERCSL